MITSFTFTISHAVKEQPVCDKRPVFHKAHIVAGLNARHCKQRHCLTGAVQRSSPWFSRDSDLHWTVGHPLSVTVDLKKNNKRKTNLNKKTCVSVYAFVHIRIYKHTHTYITCM